MAKYNVINIGGEFLNLDGAMDHSEAIELANEIEAEHNIEVKVVEVSGVTVRADYENNAELFWDTIREKHPAIAEKLQADADVFLTDEEWETVQAVEGFEDGPNYARTALLQVEE
jgi:hypothetical protein